MTSPKPVFNGKPRYNNRNHQVSRHHELVAAPHEEMVRYISDAWNKVSKEYEAHRKAGRDLTIVYYQEKVPNPQLNGFEPFDLESWWGNRILKDITQSS
ncbi:PREDICTED: protein FAM195A-like isoform X2 [Priapulus caudatus]|nr:PREDICTED: protein FAM195A-like isoform X2 [Priapulus caudatus]